MFVIWVIKGGELKTLCRDGHMLPCVSLHTHTVSLHLGPQHLQSTCWDTAKLIQLFIKENLFHIKTIRGQNQSCNITVRYSLHVHCILVHSSSIYMYIKLNYSHIVWACSYTVYGINVYPRASNKTRQIQVARDTNTCTCRYNTCTMEMYN